jgi:hypothetical protein
VEIPSPPPYYRGKVGLSQVINTSPAKCAKEDPMHDDFKKAVVEAFKELLEAKHLYQSCEIKTDHLVAPLPKRKRLSKKLPPMVRLLANMPDEMNRTGVKFNNLRVKMDFCSTWELAVGPAPESSDQARAIVLPTIRILCKCDEHKQPHRATKESTESGMIVYHAKDREEQPLQIFSIPYKCQSCDAEPVIFLVRREGLKLRLVGRSQFEPISTPACIPKQLAAHYSDAVAAFKTNHCLGALFYLRTVIEQQMRRVVKPTTRITGEELADEYQKQLSPDFPKSFPSFKKLYQDLSAALHEAREDEELFSAAVKHIEKHFDAVRLLSKA